MIFGDRARTRVAEAFEVGEPSLVELESVVDLAPQDFLLERDEELVPAGLAQAAHDPLAEKTHRTGSRAAAVARDFLCRKTAPRRAGSDSIDRSAR